MADVTATAHVFPSANDLEGGQPNGWGETLYEKNLATFWLASLTKNNFVISGALLPGSDADLTMTIPTGRFWLDGHHVEAAATAITFPASSTSHVFAKLLKDVNGNVSSVAYEHNTSGTPPADSTKIGTVTTSGSAVTSTTDSRIVGPGVSRSLPAGTYTVPAGVTRIRIRIWGASGGGGGGGGFGQSGCVTTFGSPGSPGGPGGYVEGFFDVTPGATHTITLGAAGAAGAAGTLGNSGTSGTAGGTTSFGALCSATGGGLGAFGPPGANSTRNGAIVDTTAPGVGSGGTLNQTGGGMAGGRGGAGGQSGCANAAAGGAGAAGVVIVDY